MTQMTQDLLSADLELGPPADQAARADVVPKIRHLVFDVGGKPFGIELRHVREIVGMQPITPLHDVAKYIRGLMNLRGHVVPLVDASLRLDLEARDYDERTCIIVLSLDQHEVGLIVDRVQRVVDLPATEVDTDRTRADYLRGVHPDGDSAIVCLDPHWLATASSARAPQPND